MYTDETGTVRTKGQVVALLKDIQEMARQGLLGISAGDRRQFLLAITQLESAALLLGDVTEFPRE